MEGSRIGGIDLDSKRQIALISTSFIVLSKLGSCLVESRPGDLSKWLNQTRILFFSPCLKHLLFTLT